MHVCIEDYGKYIDAGWIGLDRAAKYTAAKGSG